MDITPYSEEWLEICRELEARHSIFYKCWELGRPYFVEGIGTARVQFDPSGDFLAFEFDPKFWRETTFYDKLFVISHECLHIILNHGVRTRDAKDRQKANIALDLVVNHALVNSFSFNRSKLSMDTLCWVDTIFPDATVSDTESFEYYYNLMPESISLKDLLCMLADDHSGFSGQGSGASKDKKQGDGKDKSDEGGKAAEGLSEEELDKARERLMDKLGEGLSDEEIQSLENFFDKHFSDSDPHVGRSPVGTGSWVMANIRKAPKKKKWETIITKWSMKYMKYDYDEEEQWAKMNRRITLLPRDLIIPSEVDVDHLEEDRLPVFFFLDTSGSCWGFKDRFFKAALSLPPERFDLRLFCFDTAVQETTLESGKIYGGGGTAFSVCEQHIQKLMKTEGIAYPEAVFMITDGYGDQLNPQHPERWKFFMTYKGGNNLYCLPKQGQVYYLQDFE